MPPPSCVMKHGLASAEKEPGAPFSLHFRCAHVHGHNHWCRRGVLVYADCCGQLSGSAQQERESDCAVLFDQARQYLVHVRAADVDLPQRTIDTWPVC